MTKTIKELAKDLGCSYEAVRKQVKRYEKELQDHIFMQHKTQYLDEYACDFLRQKRQNSPTVFAKVEYDEAVEQLKKKYVELLEKQDLLRDEVSFLKEENAKIALLEADNEAVREKAAQAEKDAQEAHKELVEAQEAYEEDLRKKNDKIRVLESYAAACKEYAALPKWRRVFREPPVAPELKEQ